MCDDPDEYFVEVLILFKLSVFIYCNFQKTTVTTFGANDS